MERNCIWMCGLVQVTGTAKTAEDVTNDSLISEKQYKHCEDVFLLFDGRA